MYRSLMEVLMCPCCHGTFVLHQEKAEGDDVLEGFISCEGGHRYGIHGGILDFGSLEMEGANNWSEYYRGMSAEEVDENIEGYKSEEQKAIQEKFLSDVQEKTNALSSGFLLDVASGRGMLLRKLMESAGEGVHIIATDLSSAVLWNDRRKFQTLSSRAKVSYVACDATALPFRGESLDMVCTFAGYLNMAGLFEKGVEEGARVLKKGATFLNTLIYMKEETPGYREVKRILEENGMASLAGYILQRNVLEIHRKYFSKVAEEISHEGIAEKMEGDLLPYPGEWYANALVVAER